MALVVFLRGVNVGGHRTFRPSTLAAQLRHLDAVNIGAAGTFVIRAQVTQAKLREELASRLPFDAVITICSGRDVLKVLTQHPMANAPARPGIVRFVSVLSKRTHLTPAIPLNMPSSGAWLVRIVGREGRFVFGVYRRHMKVIGYLGTLDRLFGVSVTTRNWTTITAIANVLGTPSAST